MTLHVIGNIGLDTTFRIARFPRPGETLNASAVSGGIGGKGANQAVAAARTGVAVRLWAAIGHDVTGERLRAMLVAEGLDASGLVALDAPTDHSSILVDAAGENMIVSAVASATAFDPLAVAALTGAIAAGDTVLLQGNLTPAATAAVLVLARTRGATTIVNPSPLAVGAAVGAAMAPGGIDLLVLNALEAEVLTGRHRPEEAAPALLAGGPRIVIVTLGAAGALLAEAGRAGLLLLPAPTVAVLDTSGAGDVFCGIVAGLTALGETPEAASRIAVRAAAIAVTRSGTLASCPSAADIAALRSHPERKTP